jgi:hypothetical protein
VDAGGLELRSECLAGLVVLGLVGSSADCIFRDSAVSGEYLCILYKFESLGLGVSIVAFELLR